MYNAVFKNVYGQTSSLLCPITVYLTLPEDCVCIAAAYLSKNISL